MFFSVFSVFSVVDIFPAPLIRARCAAQPRWRAARSAARRSEARREWRSGPRPTCPRRRRLPRRQARSCTLRRGAARGDAAGDCNTSGVVDRLSVVGVPERWCPDRRRARCSVSKSWATKPAHPEVSTPEPVLPEVSKGRASIPPARTELGFAANPPVADQTATCVRVSVTHIRRVCSQIRAKTVTDPRLA